jgi:hypothetical protein
MLTDALLLGRAGRQVYLKLVQFWSRLFALGFGIGVVTGLLLSYEVELGPVLSRRGWRPRTAVHRRGDERLLPGRTDLGPGHTRGLAESRWRWRAAGWRGGAGEVEAERGRQLRRPHSANILSGWTVRRRAIWAEPSKTSMT